VKVPFRLRKKAPQAVTALLVEGDVANLLTLCTLVDADKLPAIHALPGAFLVKLPRPVNHAFPGCIRLRSLCPNFYLPADADLVPALLADEASGLVRERGLVFLPDRILSFAPHQVLRPADLLTAVTLPRRAWQAFPERPTRAERLVEVLYDPPVQTVDEILLPGGEAIGVEEPRPADAGAVANIASRAEAGAGKGLLWLGNLLHWKALAQLGANLIHRAVERVPRLSESLLGRQEAALRELLRQFREGKLEQALRRALPLNTGTQKEPPRGATPARTAILPWHRLLFSLGDLLGGGRAMASVWLTSADLHAELSAEYRKAAEAAIARGDYRRAAFIYGKLLMDYRRAADVLMQGGLHHEAAILYLDRVGDPLTAARAFEAAGEVDRALHIYRQRREHAQAGDLLRRAGEEEAAVQEYLVAADLLVASQNHLGAGDLLLGRAHRSDLALEYFAAGWELRLQGSAVPCLLRLTKLLAEQESPHSLLFRVEEAEAFFAQPGNDALAGQYFNELARLANSRNLAPLRDDLRDRALRGLALKLRQRSAEEVRAGHLVSALLGQAGTWSPPQVRDADFAFRAAVQKTRARVPTSELPRAITRTPLLPGTITALAHARQTGDVFIGFAAGWVLCFQPMTGALISLELKRREVLGLACDSTGRDLFVLQDRGPEDTGPILTSWEWSGDSYRPKASTGVPDPRGDYLVLWTTDRGENIVGVWDGSGITLLKGAQFLPWDHFGLPFPAEDFRHALLLPPRSPQNPRLSGLFFDNNSVWSLKLPPKSHPFVWHPGVPHGSALHSATLSWLQPSGDRLEVAAVSASGSVYWGAFNLAGDLQVVGKNALGGEGFRAATLIRPGHIAVVTLTGVRWLRCGEGGFRDWMETRADLPGCLACFLSPLTNELVVVCTGEIVRIPIPH
jgi:hypothetical protein